MAQSIHTFRYLVTTGSLFYLFLTSITVSAQVTALPDMLPAFQPRQDSPFPVVPSETEAAVVLVGLVVDEQEQPLPGALIIIRGTKFGTSTGADGRYRLPVPAPYLSRRGRVKVLSGQIGFLRQSLRLDARQVEQPVIRLVQDRRPLY